MSYNSLQRNTFLYFKGIHMLFLSNFPEFFPTSAKLSTLVIEDNGCSNHPCLLLLYVKIKFSNKWFYCFVKMHVIHEELVQFLRAAEKIRMIPLNNFKSERNLINFRGINKTYITVRRNGSGCHKWTQTCNRLSKVVIEEGDCWQRGTFSHSVLKVSSVIKKGACSYGTPSLMSQMLLLSHKLLLQ